MIGPGQAYPGKNGVFPPGYGAAATQEALRKFFAQGFCYYLSIEQNGRGMADERHGRGGQRRVTAAREGARYES